MKYILLFIHAITITIFQLFFGDPVTVKTNIPESAKPGSEFAIEVVINKGTAGGFAKLQVELPQGFTAREADSKGGSFTLAGQTAKIIWTSVPSDAEVKVRMIVTVDASASGDKIIQGKYSYIENNNKQQVEFSPVTVKINSDGAAATTTTTSQPDSTTAVSANRDTTQKQSFTKPEENVSPVSVVRTITAGKQPDIFEVELKIKKDAVKGFAKFQEKIPTGYMAIGQKTEGSSFTFSSADHIAKFIWTSLPSQEELTVSYKIMPKQGVEKESPANIEGELSYLENQQPKTYTLAKQELAPGTSSTPNVATTTQSENPPVNTNTIAVTTNTVSETTTNTVAATTETVNTNTIAAEPVKTETVAATTTQQQTQTTIEVTPPKNAAINYAVQVGAFKNGVNVNSLSKKYSLSNVRTEMHDGFTKCLVGKHTEYKSARDARETVKAKGVTDAFVTAYNSGQRITVQEALMITSQKWFR